MDFQRQMQQGLSIQASKVKAKRRKAEKIEIHGGFMVRATGSRDRHSKVCTARGTRERRVRLSPRTAIQFYDVQDRLGYDRPSEAIDWLMKEAKAAIDSLNAEAKIQQIEIESGIMKSELEMIQRRESLNDQNVISNLSFLGDDFNQDGSILSTYSSQILNTNFDLESLQRFLTWNCTNANSVNPREETETFIRSPHHHFQAPPILSSNQLFSQREPLQSSVFDYSPTRSEFPGILHVAGDEFPYCTTEKEHEGDRSPVPSKPFSAATFLHHEGR